jgi:RNA polymerase sigma-70 factor, ECF subfamily
LCADDEDTLETLIGKICTDRDGTAAERFYERSKNLVYGFIRRKYSSMQTSDVDDAFHGFFEKLVKDNWRRLCAWQGPAAASTYLITILRNFLIDEYRRARPTEDESAIENIGDDPTDRIEHEFLLREIQPALLKAIEKLPDRDGDIINRTLIAEESAEQLASYFGLTKNAYYAAYHRAKQRLSTVMKKEFAEYFEDF